MHQMSGKRVLVIGGSRGIGKEIVTRFSSAGAKVTFTHVTPSRAVDELVASTGATAIRNDASDRDALIRAVLEAGPVDIFVYNAGLSVGGDPLELIADDVDRMINVNIRGAYFSSVEAARAMPDGGRIILIGSVVADRVPFPGIAAYSMTKSALQGMARGLARDLARRNITVNVVQPGPTNTDMNPANGPEADLMYSVMAMKRHGTPDAVAGLVIYLAGPDAAGTTGAMHTIDGGFGA